jgi:S-adenosylmethionine-diacylglycerol 3-amino-3-carboxypropyl transferase
MSGDAVAERIRGRIVYSQCWEDPATGQAALELRPDDDLLVVTSGGCNALAFALAGPRTITALDVNPAQNHLLELKIAALRGLEHPSLLRFVGVRDAQDRLGVYDRLRTGLSRDARDFWDRQPAAIARGVLHAGRFERFLRIFRRAVLPLMHRNATVETLLALDGGPAQRAFYDEVWNTRRWRLLFQLFFGKLAQSRLGRYPEFFREVELTNVGRHYLARARHVLAELPVRGNWFVEYILTGTYRDPDAGPPYLRPSNHHVLRERLDTIEIVTDDVESYLDRPLQRQFSAFYLSDVFEWMDRSRYEGTLIRIARAGRPGARLCYYNNLVPRRRPDLLAHALVPDDVLGRRLHTADRSFVYSDVVVERVVEC